MTPIACVCSCENTSFAITNTPLFRIICHCSICQRFNNAPFADVVVYTASSVEDPPEGSVKFDTYKPPPNVQRGNCTKCGDAAIEKFAAPLFPKLTIVPKHMHSETASLPDPVGHMFYENRVADVDDSLPKRKGLVASQLLFGKHLLLSTFSKS